MITRKEAKPIPIKKIEAYLKEKYPKCFNDNYLPLKVGIFHDVMAENPPYEKREIRKVFELYTEHKEYQEKILQAGHPRYNLNGEICGEVTELQIEKLRILLEKKKVRQERKQKKLEARLAREAAAALAEQAAAAQAEKTKEKPVEQATKKPKKTKKAQEPKPEKKPKEKAVKADSKVQAKPKKAEPKKTVEPVIKTKKEVKISLGERREGKPVPTTGKKKLSLKKT